MSATSRPAASQCRASTARLAIISSGRHQPFHSSACWAAVRSVRRSPLPATSSGSGEPADFGSFGVSTTVKNSPTNVVRRSCSRDRRIAAASSNRSDRVATSPSSRLYASCSLTCHPAPMPRTTRPPLIWSVDVILGEDRRVPVGHGGDERAQPQPARDGGQAGEHRPHLEHGVVGVDGAGDVRHEVVGEPQAVPSVALGRDRCVGHLGPRSVRCRPHAEVHEPNLPGGVGGSAGGPDPSRRPGSTGRGASLVGRRGSRGRRHEVPGGTRPASAGAMAAGAALSFGPARPSRPVWLTITTSASGRPARSARVPAGRGSSVDVSRSARWLPRDRPTGAARSPGAASRVTTGCPRGR